MLPVGDWEGVFRPAVLALLNGQDPYQSVFYNPPWLLAPLIPFAVLPSFMGRILLLIVSLSAFAFVGWKLKATPIGMAAFILSPLAYFSLAGGNVEWLVALGFVTSPAIGLVLLASKPQASVLAIILIAYACYRERQWKPLVLPVAILILSLIFYGDWLEHALSYSSAYASEPLNVSHLFPYSLVLVAASIVFRWRSMRFLSAFAFPVTTVGVWSIPLLALIRHTRWMVVLTLTMWVVMFIFAATR